MMMEVDSISDGALSQQEIDALLRGSEDEELFGNFPKKDRLLDKETDKFLRTKTKNEFLNKLQSIILQAFDHLYNQQIEINELKKEFEHMKENEDKFKKAISEFELPE